MQKDSLRSCVSVVDFSRYISLVDIYLAAAHTGKGDICLLGTVLGDISMAEHHLGAVVGKGIRNPVGTELLTIRVQYPDDGEYDTNDFAYHLFESYYYRHLVAAFYLTVLVSPALKCSFFCLPL